MAAYSPPFTLTHAMLSRVAEIAKLVGQWRFAQSSQVPMLRRENRISTIQASLAIEHNTLSVEQVTAVIEGKTVLGLPREIQEVRNAFAAYEAMPDWGPASPDWADSAVQLQLVCPLLCITNLFIAALSNDEEL